MPCSCQEHSQYRRTFTLVQSRIRWSVELIDSAKPSQFVNRAALKRCGVEPISECWSGLTELEVLHKEEGMPRGFLANNYPSRRDGFVGGLLPGAVR